MATTNPFAPNDPPNLDDFSTDPDDFDAASEAMHLYGRILKLKAAAMRLRQSGNIADAIMTEQLSDKRYMELPEWARW